MKLSKANLLGFSVLTLCSVSISAQAQTFDIQSATATGSHPIFPPSNAIDGDVSFESRWVGDASPEEIRLDLGQDQRVDDVRIAWGRGDRHTYTFEIAGRSGTSGDWTTVFAGTSSGNTAEFENYNVADITARQIRIRGLSNSFNRPFTHLSEVQIIGTSGPSAETTPAPTPTSDLNIVYSLTDDRSGARNLDGGNVSGEVFVFIDRNDEADVARVRFYLDDVLVKIEREAPFDLSAVRNDPRAFNVDNLEDGNHRLRADFLFNDGRRDSVEVQFNVGEAPSDDFGLDPNAEPWENFDLDDWAYDSPAERPEDNCRAIRSDEDEWDEFRDSPSSPYFFTHTDGGMRFVSPVGGATTSRSCDSGFPRSELREMLRRGNTSISTTGVNLNNWALGYQPEGGNYGGRNGKLTASLRVNQVTTTGDGLHPGRTIIGQIHADNDEPARLYYRKLPGADRGCVYLEHEIRDGDDVTFNLIGDERCSGNGPDDGIALDELFSYEIINDDEDVIVNIRRGDQNAPIIASRVVDMNVLNSGYDRSDEWMYFKAGAYTQNNTGDPEDTDIITFYHLENTHDAN